MQVGLSTYSFKFHVGQDFVGCLLLILPGIIDAYVHRADFALWGACCSSCQGFLDAYEHRAGLALYYTKLSNAIYFKLVDA